MGKGLQEIISLEGDASPPIFNPPLWHSLSLTEANIHFRSAISNVAGPLLAQGYQNKGVPSIHVPRSLPRSANEHYRPVH